MGDILNKNNQLSRRKFLRNASLAALCFGLGLSQTSCYNPTFKRGSDLNIELGTEHSYVEMSRKKGEKRLDEIALTATKEDAWLFFEITDFEGKKGTWVNFGEISTPSTVSTDVELPDILFEKFKHYQNEHDCEVAVSHYHIHPLNYYLQSLAKISKDAGRSILVTGELLEYLSAPSFMDAEVYMVLDKKIQKQGLSLGYHYVMAPLGSFQCAPTPALFEFYKKKGIAGAREALLSAADCSYVSLESVLDKYRKAGLDVVYRKKRSLTRQIIIG